MITVVTGLPRSGTTLAMRMLYRGGLQVVAENKVSFEDGRAAQPPLTEEFMLECDNKAVKILSPLYHRPPFGFNYKFILMIRDAHEMMKSHAKWDTGNRYGHQKVKPRQAKKALWSTYEMLKRYGGPENILKVHFEDILANGVEQASRIAQFLERDMDVEHMAECIMDRGPECLPTMIEWDLEEEE